MPHTVYNGDKPAIGLAQDKALNDYSSVLGKVIRVEYLLGYRKDDVNGADGRQDLYPTGGALVRVVDTPLGDVIGRVCCDHLDPEWDLELVEPHKDLEAYDGFHTFGTSYDLVKGTSNNDSGWELVEA